MFTNFEGSINQSPENKHCWSIIYNQIGFRLLNTQHWEWEGTTRSSDIRIQWPIFHKLVEILLLTRPFGYINGSSFSTVSSVLNMVNVIVIGHLPIIFTIRTMNLIYYLKGRVFSVIYNLTWNQKNKSSIKIDKMIIDDKYDENTIFVSYKSVFRHILTFPVVICASYQ